MVTLEIEKDNPFLQDTCTWGNVSSCIEYVGVYMVYMVCTNSSQYTFVLICDNQMLEQPIPTAQQLC